MISGYYIVNKYLDSRDIHFSPNNHTRTAYNTADEMLPEHETSNYSTQNIQHVNNSIIRSNTQFWTLIKTKTNSYRTPDTHTKATNHY